MSDFFESDLKSISRSYSYECLMLFVQIASTIVALFKIDYFVFQVISKPVYITYCIIYVFGTLILYNLKFKANNMDYIAYINSNNRNYKNITSYKKQYRTYKSNKLLSVIFNVIYFSLMLLLMVQLLVELPINDISLSSLTSTGIYYVYNIALVSILTSVLYFSFPYKSKLLLTASIIFKSILTAVVFLVAAMFQQVYLYRQTEVMPYDIYNIGTLKNVIGTYSFKPYFAFYVSIFVLIIIIIYIIINSYSRYKAYKFSKLYECLDNKIINTQTKLKPSYHNTVVLILLFTCVSAMITMPRRVIYVNTWNYIHHGNTIGLPLGFFLLSESLAFPELGNYKDSIQYTKENLTGYTEEQQEKLESFKNLPYEQKPDVLVIMNESYSDIQQLINFETNKPVMPFIDKLQQSDSDRVDTGNVVVPYLGGLTCNTEFEALTGLTNIFFSYNLSPFQVIINNPVDTYVSYFKELGYDTVGYHPFFASGWNRDKVYDDYFKFDRSIFGEDMAGKERLSVWSGLTDRQLGAFGDSFEYIRTFISDRSNYQYALDNVLNAERDKPVFMFNVTIQNHGNYDIKDGVINNPVEVLSTTQQIENLTESQQKAVDDLEQYVSVIHESDIALEELLDYLENDYDRPIIVCMFGDHLPALDFKGLLEAYPTTVDIEKPNEAIVEFQTPFVVWANSKVKLPNVIEKIPERFSTNYLLPNILTKYGFPINKQTEFLLQLQEQFPILSISGGIFDSDYNYEVSSDKLVKGGYDKFIDIYHNLIQYRLYDEYKNKK